jgi:hypothetical protein
MVRHFSESERPQIVALTTKIGQQIARPCQHLHLLESDRQPIIAAQLGCGKREITFTSRAEAFSSEVTHSPQGGGSYRHKHIFTHKEKGKIQ